jgi:hypothetical protein
MQTHAMHKYEHRMRKCELWYLQHHSQVDIAFHQDAFLQRPDIENQPHLTYQAVQKRYSATAFKPKPQLSKASKCDDTAPRAQPATQPPSPNIKQCKRRPEAQNNNM